MAEELYLDKYGREEFFNAVKGKPILWSSWTDVDRAYFIPESYKGYRMWGTTYYLDGQIVSNDFWEIGNGFSYDENAYRWYLYYDLIAEQDINRLLED
jgi:hypothetical protein